MTSIAVMSAMFLVSCGGGESSDTEGKEGNATEQAQEEEKEQGPSIIGDWQCTDMDMGMEIPEAQQAMFDELIAAMSYSFKEDGTMSVTAKMGSNVTTESGTYKVEDNKIIGTKDGQSDTINIVSLTESELVLGMEDQGVEMTISFEKK